MTDPLLGMGMAQWMPVLVTPVGFFILAALAIGRGWFYPKKHYEEMKSLYASRLEDRDLEISRLKQTNEALDKRNDLLMAQVQKMVEAAKTSNAIVAALPAPNSVRTEEHSAI